MLERAMKHSSLTLAIQFALLLLLVFAAHLGAERLQPKNKHAVAAFDIKAHLPKTFGDWQLVESPYLQVSLIADNASFNQPYDAIEMVSYQNADGAVLALALAWGREQSQEVKIHQPPLCYKSQGYRIDWLSPHSYESLSNHYRRPIKGLNMLASNDFGSEAVSYWMRVGERFSQSGKDTRLHIFEQGLAGNIPDGILVRASVKVPPGGDQQVAFTTLDEFLFSFVAASPQALTRLMLGKA